MSFYCLGVVSSSFSGLGDLLKQILSYIIALLPNSPFWYVQTYLTKFDKLNEILGYLNYFIPISAMLSVLGYWLVAITLFYAYQVVLRWVKAVGD